MMDWATPAAACEKSDFVQMSCSRQPLPRLLHHPVFQAVCFSRENPCLLLGFLPPSLPPFSLVFFPALSFLLFFLFSFFSVVSLTCLFFFFWFISLSPFLFSWDLAGRGPPKALRFFLLNHGLESKSPLSPSRGLRVISTPVLAQGIS